MEGLTKRYLKVVRINKDIRKTLAKGKAVDV